MTRFKAKPKVKPTEITRRTTRSVTAKLYQSCLKIPKVPDDIFQSILNIHKADGDYRTLTSVARTNRNMYDMVIPMIYGVVVFNRGNCAGKNRKMIGYGHGSPHDDEEPTRKDIATSLTRKVIFHELPDMAMLSSYRAVNEVVLNQTGLYSPCSYSPYTETPLDYFRWIKLRFDRLARVIASPDSPVNSLHVKVHIDAHHHPHEAFMALFISFESAIPCTYEITDIGIENSEALCAAYDLQCVVALWAGWPPNPTRKAQQLASHINECFKEKDLDTPTGQLFLCDVPSLVLNPRELASPNVEDTAINKICDLVSVYPNLDGSIYKTKLDFFKSRIKLVKSGFKPTLADLYPRPQLKRGLSSVLLPEGSVLVPDDEWSLTDDEPMESEAEYSGSETSDFDSDSDSDSNSGE